MKTICVPVILFSTQFALLRAADPSGTPASAAPGQESEEILTGPWGAIDYYEVPLECPDEIVPYLRIPSQEVEWIFKVSTREEWEAALVGAGLNSDEISFLLEDSMVIRSPEMFKVFPRDESILSIPPETRSKLHRLLSEHSENRFYRRPIYFNTENLSAWFRGSELPRAMIEDIARLAYPTPSGHGFYFVDVALALRRSTSGPAEKVLFQSLLRRHGLVVRLHLDGESNTREIAEYWTAGYKNKAVLPLLDSMKERNMTSLDVAHLLPATPRQYLNLFPDLTDAMSGQSPDWFWTCYNFFRFTPLSVYANSEEVNDLIRDEFDPVEAPYQFGDMLLLLSEKRVIHGCVYIAGDVVYTKNSPDIFTPWNLMRIRDVVGLHDVHGDVSIVPFRKRQPAGGDAP